MESKNTQDSPYTWYNAPSRKVHPLTVETSKEERQTGTKGRLRRRTDTREGAGRQSSRGWLRREEPGRRLEGHGAGGAQQDPGHSHDDGPRWRIRREEPWRRDGCRLHGAIPQWWSRWWRSLRRRRRANETESRELGTKWSRWVYMPRRSPGLGGGCEGYSSPTTLEDGRLAGLTPYRWGAEGEQGGCQTTAVEEAGAGGRTGIFEERALEDRKHSQGWTREPKTKEGWTGPAGMTREEKGQFDLLFGLPVNQILIHIQQSQMYNQLTLSCSAGGRSSTPHSHHPRLSPSWWALSPALAPGLTGWAQLPRQTSAQSLGFALACGSRWEMQCSTTEPQEHCTHAQVQGLYVCKHKMLLNTSWISYFHSSPFTFNGRPFLTSVTLCNFLQNTSIYDKGNTKNEVQEPIITNFSKRMKLKGVTSGFDTGCSLCAPLINRQTIRCWIADRYTLTVEKGCPEGPVGSTSNPKLNARKEQCFCLRTNPQTPSIWVWLATRGLEHPHPTVHHRQPERRKGAMRRDLQRPSWISATPWGSLGGGVSTPRIEDSLWTVNLLPCSLFLEHVSHVTTEGFCCST